jgi:hypothetical protein
MDADGPTFSVAASANANPRSDRGNWAFRRQRQYEVRPLSGERAGCAVDACYFANRLRGLRHPLRLSGCSECLQIFLLR